jgi:hypothetical protein
MLLTRGWLDARAVGMMTTRWVMLSLNRILSPVSTAQGETRPPKGNRRRGWLLGDNQEGDGLIILDQHGAHERILYEKLPENRGRAGPSRTSRDGGPAGVPIRRGLGLRG